MPRYDDDDDDRPRRRRPRDDDDDFDDRPSRSHSRRGRDDDDDDDDDRPLPPRRQKSGSGLWIILGIIGGVLLLCIGGGVGVGVLLYNRAAEFGERNVSSNNMKEIVLGCHSYSDRNGMLPTNSYSADGRALLSWRVHILPFIGHQALHAKFRLDEPWDGPNNRRLLSEMPIVYATPAEREAKKWGTTTYYRGFSNVGALFEKSPMAHLPGAFVTPRGVPLMGITDGTSNTIVVVEAGDSVEWTKPDDLDLSPGRAMPKLGGVRPKADTILAAFADGSVRPVKRTSSEMMWRGAVSYRGGEVIFLE